jgi:hypothetical protein
MPNSKTKKEIITEAVLTQLPKLDSSTNEVIKVWWFTRSSDNLRLTATGDMSFRQAEIEFFDVPVKITQQTYYSFISECGKKLQCPYYIGFSKEEKAKGSAYIRLYDSKIAMMMTLYGDIQSYLNSVKIRK